MTERSDLRRTLGFTDLMMVTLGTVIGSGIFLVPGVVLRQTQGRVGLALSIWFIAGVLSLLGAFTYAELGAMKPDAGGLYTYLRDAFGPLPAFLYGWASFFVIASGSIATLAVAFSGYLGEVVPLSPIAARAVSLLVILVITVVNVAGTRRSATMQNWTTGAKVCGLLALSGAMIALGSGERIGVSAAPASSMRSLLPGIGTATIGVLWAYEGWQYVTFSAGETRDPQRVFPRAIAVATLILVGLYILANIGYITALGPIAASRSDHVAADAMRAVFGPTSGGVLSVLVLVSIFSAANGLMLTTPRMYFAMARDGVFFERLASVHVRFGTPAFAIVALALWSALLAVSGTFEQLLTYVVFAGWIFYGLGGVAVFVYRRTQPDAIRPFRTPGYPVTPVLFVASAALLVLSTLIAQPIRGGVGIGAVLLGTPVFYMWRARRRRAIAAILVGGLIASPRVADAQIPSAVEFRVPKAPSMATSDSGTFIAYELHVTNLTPGTMMLRRVEVLDAGRAIADLADSALVRVVARPGPVVPPAERLRIGGGQRAYVYLWIAVDRKSPPARLNQRLTFQRADSTTEILEGAQIVVERAVPAIGAPVRGEWAAFNGPSNASGHRRLVLALDGHVASGQRFAIDFLQVDSSGRTRRPGSDAATNANYYAYGHELLAVADGIVVATKDSIPENVPGISSRAVKIDLVTVGGNFVGIDIGGGKYALYAHVQPGSLRVKGGDRVRRGQVLALLGNSGNSTEPHVHFQIADAPAFLSSEGVPYAADFDVIGNCGIGGTPPAIQCTRHAPTAVKGGIPLQNELVRFPN